MIETVLWSIAVWVFGMVIAALIMGYEDIEPDDNATLFITALILWPITFTYWLVSLAWRVGQRWS